ncbi:MAG TPA: serine/threonine-protein kinase, partial [Gemmataceae bacterium]|nr:serine/threonine-protein kinase [Gemmataceae bacterium]
MMPEPVQTSPAEESLSAVLTELLEMLEQGQAPDRNAWTSRYPQFAAELEEFFTSHEHFEPWAAPLRSVVRALMPTPRPEESPTPGEGPDGPVPAAPDRVPGSLPDYELLAEIGQGGMGVVYKARQKSLNRLVAVKMIRAGGPAREDDLRRFRNEAEAVAHLDHAQIVPVHEVGEHAGQHYFTMKLIEGGSLDRQLACFSAEPKAAARLLAAVARAVHHAHQRGILHRDLKPGNVLVDAAGQPHVTDFGLAKRVEVDSSLTQSGVLIGTPSYMAPEQTSGVRGAITTATDVYGLGAVLYAMLTGQPPFRGDHVLETLRQVREQEPQSPSAVNPRVDRDLATITLKCLRKEPEQRYASAAALADDLERWLKDEPIRAKRPSLLQRLVRWRRRHKPLVGSVAVLMILVLLLGGAVLGWQQRQLAATEQAVEGDLREADLLQQQERWSDVLQVLERASGRLAAGGPSPLRERVEQRRTIVAMVAQLEEARLQGSAAGPEGFDYTGADQAYAAAFASYGLNLETFAPEEAAERIRTSPIRTQLVAALDDWAFIKTQR